MNNLIRVLVADSNENATKEIEKYFCSHEVIKVVACKNNGEETLEYIINHVDSFDVIVMDLLLPKMDGLFLLGELKRRGILKKVIITTGFSDQKMIDEANLYGVNYYMLKPINYMSLERRLLSIGTQRNTRSLVNVESALTDLLHSLGIPSHIRGFQYVRDGILITYARKSPINFITKDIYPELSRKYNTTPSRVERAIRHAIEVSWTRGDIKLIDDVFGNSIDINRDKPTNSEFIATIADRLRVKANVIYN